MLLPVNESSVKSEMRCYSKQRYFFNSETMRVKKLGVSRGEVKPRLGDHKLSRIITPASNFAEILFMCEAVNLVRVSTGRIVIPICGSAIICLFASGEHWNQTKIRTHSITYTTMLITLTTGYLNIKKVE